MTDVPEGTRMYAWQALDYNLAAIASERECNFGEAYVPFIPSIYLFSIAIELSFKSIMLLGGAKEDELRKAGHDIRKSLTKALRYKPYKIAAQFENSDRDVLELIRDADAFWMDDGKGGRKAATWNRLRYPRTGPMRLPLYRDVLPVASKCLLSALTVIPRAKQGKQDKIMMVENEIARLESE